MLQQMAAQNDVVVSSRMTSVTKMAALALVAEQFGFMYGDARQTGARMPRTEMLLHRDPSPEAQQRAAANWQRFPNAANGGDVPGMQPGGKPVPLPEAVPHVELLKARINFDLTGKNSEKRMMWGAIGICAVIVYWIIRAAVRGQSPVGSVVFGLILLAVVGAGFLWNRQRNARFAATLESSGLVKAVDETGRTRYLPPGGRLPAQGGAFAQPVQQPGPVPVPQQPGGQYPQSYGGPQAPYAQPQAPYAQPQPQPQAPYAQPQQPSPYVQPPQGGFGPPPGQ